MKENLILFLAIALAGVLCFFLYKWMFTPRRRRTVRKSAKRVKKVSSKVGFKENQKALQQKIAIARLFANVPLVRMTKDTETEIRQLLQAVDERTATGRLLIPEEIYLRQLMIAGAILVVTVLLMILVSPFCVFAMLAIPFCMRIPIQLLRNKRDRFAIALADEFLAFYKLYYVQFIRRDNTTTLSYVINSYIPVASFEVKKILKVLDGDLAKGEEFALKRFDARFPDSPKVHKFCAVAKARIKADDSCFETMKSFLALLTEEHDVYFDREKEKREHLLDNLVIAFLSVSMVIVSCMIFGMMFTSS